MFFLVFVLFLYCFSNMHLCAKQQPYSSKKLLCKIGIKPNNLKP